MRCARCGNGLESGWRFCPGCGLQKGANPVDAFGRDLFSKMFKRLKMDKMFENNMQVIDLSPSFGREEPRKEGVQPRSRGFTVHIKSGTGMKPKVNVTAFGNVNKKALENHVSAELGSGRPEEAGRGISLPFSRRQTPKVTEEPNADVKRIGDKFTVDVDMPGVKSPEDVEIRELASSVEVKAVAGDKAYFKIITKPENLKLSGRAFRKGSLHLEFS